MLNKIQLVAVFAIPVLFAITVHEVAHGWVAKRLGDPTAMLMGRLTLNPLKHIDPIGTVLLPIAMLVITGFMFGWAKPVPITWDNLKHPKRDIALVAVAGPTANLLMALFWALVLKIALLLPASAATVSIPLSYMGFAGIFINGILMILNLLPLPPLDGGRIMSSLLPGPWSYKFSRLEPYGLLILMVLLFTGILGAIMLPPLAGYLNFVTFAFGIEPQVFQALASALLGAS
ncbi:MAG TPA: site-2 protease family protein [Gammaproteobacteria bacterium]